MQEPPEVTVRDPRRAAPPADVLGDDRPGWRPSRRQVVATLLVALAAVVAAGGRELQQRHEVQADDRRLGAVVSLERAQRFGGETITHTAGDTGVVERRVGLRNTGPRGITVLSGLLGAFTLAGPVDLAPGEDAPLRLVQELDCRTDPGLLPDDRELQLDVRTDQGVRVTALPLDSDQTWDSGQARRACGYLDLFEAGSITVADVRLDGDAVRIGLQASNSSRAPLRLLSVRGGRGLSLELRDEDGRPVPLPLTVPAGLVEEPRPLLLTGLLRVVDCAVVQPPVANGFEPDGSGTLSYLFGDAPHPDGEGAAMLGLVDTQPVADLLERVC